MNDQLELLVLLEDLNLLLDFGSPLFDGQSSVSEVLALLGDDDGFVLIIEGLGGDSSLLLGRPGGVSSDGSENLGVEGLDVLDSVLLEAFEPKSEVSFVLLGVVLLHVLHVLVDVASEDSVSVHIGVVLELSLSVVLGDGSTIEVSGVVRDVETTVTGALKDGVHSVSNSGTDESDIKDGLEGSLILTVGLGDGSDVVVLTTDISLALVHGVHTDLLEQSSGEEETGSIGGGVVDETSSDSESLELGRVSVAKHSVTLEGGVDDLGDASVVGDSHNKSVLVATQLIDVLKNHSLSGIVVSLSFSSSSELSLISFEVLLRFYFLDEASHFMILLEFIKFVCPDI